MENGGRRTERTEGMKQNGTFCWKENLEQRDTIYASPTHACSECMHAGFTFVRIKKAVGIQFS